MFRTVSGPSGVIKWGYRSVARFGAWRYESGTVTAQVQSTDEFGLTQVPLVVSVHVGASTWRWPVLALHRDGMAATITVGPLQG